MLFREIEPPSIKNNQYDIMKLLGTISQSRTTKHKKIN